MMKYLRYEYEGRACFGVVEGQFVQELTGNFLAGGMKTGVTRPLTEIRLLSPCIPGKIIGVGANYCSFLDAKNRPYPSVPRIFLKPGSAVIGPDDKICLPDPSHEVHYEGELGVVIGKRCSHIKACDYDNYIFGYTCVNDVSDITMMQEDGIWSRGKGCDTFAPVGPVITAGVREIENSMIKTRVNREVVQHMPVSDMCIRIPQLLEYISTYFTLEPGDLIATGTPVGVGCLHPGDSVEVEIDGIGSMINFVE